MGLLASRNEPEARGFVEQARRVLGTAAPPDRQRDRCCGVTSSIVGELSSPGAEMTGAVLCRSKALTHRGRPAAREFHERAVNVLALH